MLTTITTINKPTIAIGQEISVSALQMVQAATAIANGGVPVKLSVIHKITDKEGAVLYKKPFRVHDADKMSGFRMNITNR